MAVAITRYFENVRYFNSIYQKLKESASGGTHVNFADIAPKGTTLRTITGVELTDQVNN